MLYWEYISDEDDSKNTIINSVYVICPPFYLYLH